MVTIGIPEWMKGLWLPKDRPNFSIWFYLWLDLLGMDLQGTEGKNGENIIKIHCRHI